MLIYKDLDEGRSHQSVKSYQFAFPPVLLQRRLGNLSTLLLRLSMNCSWSTSIPKNLGIYQKRHLQSVGGCLTRTLSPLRNFCFPGRESSWCVFSSPVTVPTVARSAPDTAAVQGHGVTVTSRCSTPAERQDSRASRKQYKIALKAIKKTKPKQERTTFLQAACTTFKPDRNSPPSI